jgi:hypothetical protein
MAKMMFSRNDIESLARRMEDRSWSRLMNDLPELQRDIRSAARLLHYFIQQGMPPTPVAIDNNGRSANDNPPAMGE